MVSWISPRIPDSTLNLQGTPFVALGKQMAENFPSDERNIGLVLMEVHPDEAMTTAAYAKAQSVAIWNFIVVVLKLLCV
jgi:hypothetical protein